MKLLFLPLILISSSFGLQAMDEIENLKKEAANNNLTEQMVDEALHDFNSIEENSQPLSNFALELKEKAFSEDKTIAKYKAFFEKHPEKFIPEDQATIGFIHKGENYLGMLKVIEYTYEYCASIPEELINFKDEAHQHQQELREIVATLKGNNAPEHSTLKSITSRLFSKEAAIAAVLLFASYWYLSGPSDKKITKGPLD